MVIEFHFQFDQRAREFNPLANTANGESDRLTYVHAGTKHIGNEAVQFIFHKGEGNRDFSDFLQNVWRKEGEKIRSRFVSHLVSIPQFTGRDFWSWCFEVTFVVA